MDHLFHMLLKFAVYKKREIPSADDELWRLKRIRKNGIFQKALEQNGIFSVKDLLRRYHKDENALRNVRQKFFFLLRSWISLTASL
jgi:predicted metalloprotease